MSDRAAALAEFARSCKAAARAVSLYPGAHPAIRSALARVTAAAQRLTAGGEATLTVLPDGVGIDGVEAVAADLPTAELAAILHERLVGELRIHPGTDAEDWRALLLILARPTEDVVAEGGIASAWTATGRHGFDIREIDYAEVLRERAGGGAADWDRIVAWCLRGDAVALDERALESLFDVPGDPARMAALIERFERGPAARSASIGARTAALLTLIRAAVEAAGKRGVPRETALQTVADAGGRLTPDMIIGLLANRQSPDADNARLAAGVIARMGEGAIASFVAGSIVAERTATDRLAYAFHALVPDEGRREPVLELAHAEVSDTLGAEEGFSALWQTAARMLTSYSDEKFVSDAYARELSGARAQAIEVERVSDDPSDRVQAWLFSISADAVERLDLAMLLDLARIEGDPAQWGELASIVATEIEQRTLLGDIAGANRLTEVLVRETGDEGRPGLADAARQALDALASGDLVRNLLLHLRKVEKTEDMERISELCRLAGPRLARPLAEALSVEQHPRAIRHLRELLLAFGAAGRQSVEQLKSSPNPAVRRTAIDLLRVFGGREALPELASMLDDADPQVQRESIRAIVQIGTNEAYAILERALVVGGASRDNLVQQLIGLRDDKAIPLLCYVLDHTRPRGLLVNVHLEIIEALGGLGDHRETTRALKVALHRGEWWAPRRTAALRGAAAAALRRIGSNDTRQVLDEAAAQGSRGVRNAVQAASGPGSRQGARA